MKKLLGSIGGPLLIFTVFVIALWFLHAELKQYHLQDVLNSLAATPKINLAIAIGLTVISYILLIAYDWMGIRYLSRTLDLGRISLASLLGYAIGNSFSSLLGGSTVRYRLYSAWGFSAIEIFKLMVFLSVTLWIGVLFLGGTLVAL